MKLVFGIFSPTTTSSIIQVSLLWSIVSVVTVNVTCWIIFNDVFCAGNGSDRLTSVLCCRYQHGLVTRASVTCDMYIYFPFYLLYFCLQIEKSPARFTSRAFGASYCQGN